jgi:S-methylmethionine-dependent homocysteine/selenocysteine methylase
MSDIQILDGGLGQELWKRGVNKHPVLWSTNALITDPDSVADVHLEFIKAGANIITTNTYCTNPWRLRQAGIEDEFEALNMLAVALCEKARAAHISARSPVKIAASLPPLYGTYKTDMTRDDDHMFEEYRRMSSFLAPHVDILLCETMTNEHEARAAARACQGLGKPVWLAWTLDDAFNERGDAVLRDGTTIKNAFKALPEMAFEALLFNCCQPEVVDDALKQLGALTDITIGAYANGFTAIPDEFDLGNAEVIGKRTDLAPAAYLEFTKEWQASGASIIGGCCEIGPEHIAALSRHYHPEAD